MSDVGIFVANPQKLSEETDHLKTSLSLKIIISTGHSLLTKPTVKIKL
jgi:hypothetical protein